MRNFPEKYTFRDSELSYRNDEDYEVKMGPARVRVKMWLFIGVLAYFMYNRRIKNV